jgi:hypothetical protein
MEFILENWKYLTAIISIASIFVNLTPNETNNKFLVVINKILNVFAANINVKGIGNR